MKSVASAACTCLAIALLAPAARSQAVRGNLVNRDSGRPIAGAIVGLQDSTGTIVEQRLTYEPGGFLIQTAHPGTFRFQVLRIGFRPWYSDYFELRAGEQIVLSIRLRPEPVVLDELVAESDRCTTDPEAGTRTAQLLEEARKAFLAAEATMRGGDFRFRIMIFKHRLEPDLGHMVETRDSTSTLRVWPIDAEPAESLDAHGFVRRLSHPDGPIYFGIDGGVLLSDTFLESHCFFLRSPKGDLEGRVGLVFRPAGFYLRPDVEGVFWVDAKTLAPHALEYWYVGLPPWVPKREAGGRFDFAELPNAGWVIRRWWLRAPIPKVSRVRTNPRLFGYAIEGGEVVEMQSRSGTRLFDLRGAPLPELPGVLP
ncbi:MAG: carboxypeptidase regulatory-like domain-containing protein [Gemmatimonadales bacterium]|nr:carboxypeptidase regulatory-like domain-containing protein [Gemmatimonadales bacterium]